MKTIILKSNKKVRQTVSEEAYGIIMGNPMTAELYTTLASAEEPEEVTILKAKKAAAKKAASKTNPQKPAVDDDKSSVQGADAQTS